MLTRPPYAELEPGLVERAWEGLLRLLGDALTVLAEAGGGGLLGTAVLLVMLALVIAVLVRLLRRVGRAPGVAEPEVALRGRSAADWHADADRHRDDGRWRDALRCRYRGLVAELAAAGLVQEIPGRTAGEYRAEVAESVPAAADAFAAATARFERAWYADAPVTSDSLEELEEHGAQVRHAAGLRRSVAGIGR